MKTVLLTLALGYSALSGQFAVRIAVTSPEVVPSLVGKGYTIDDARIMSRTRIDNRVEHCAVYAEENGFVTVIGEGDVAHRLQEEGFQLLSITTQESPLFERTPSSVIPYQFGWPRAIFNGLSLYDNSPTVADMDLNGQLDVSVTNAWGSFNPANPPYIITWRYNGAYLSGFPAPLEPGFLQSSAESGISAAGDIFGDDKLELVCGDENGNLYAFNHDGSRLTGFPQNYGSTMGVFVPALADVDNDGKKDIAFITHTWNSPYTNAQLHLVRVTATGVQEFSGYPIALELGSRTSPAIGDLDADGTLEIVVGTGGRSDSTILAKVIAFTPTGQIKNGFPWIVGKNTVGNPPTLYDLDNDGTLEILIRVKPDYNNVNGIYGIDHTGNVLPQFPMEITFGHSFASVAVGDMTGDGIPEIAYGGVEAVDSGKVWVFTLDGNLLPGFPARVYRTWVDGSVSIGDVDGDGWGDVVCGTNGVSGKPGVIRAYNYLGEEITGFPLIPPDNYITSFETHPTLVDIDGDGDTEIFAGRVDKFVYGWDTPGLYDSTRVWSTLKGNPARTGGMVRSPFAVSAEKPIDLPGKFNLEQNFPNPFNPSTSIRVTLPHAGDVTLRIFDVTGHVVRSFLYEKVSAGILTVEWDGFNGAGFPASSGVYFCQAQFGDRLLTRKMILLK